MTPRTIKKIMLIMPPLTRPVEFSAKVARVSPFFPLGMAYIAAVLEQTGKYELKILDAVLEGNFSDGVLSSDGKMIRYGLTDEQILEYIRAFKPDLVGVAGLFSGMQEDMGHVCQLVKQVNPATYTTVGGTHAGNMAEEILHLYPFVDCVIIGEAEETYLQLLNYLQGMGPKEALDGLAFRQGTEMIMIPKTRYIQNLDTIPFPAYHLFDLSKYFAVSDSHGFFRHRPYMQMVTSRGCPCKCAFCALGPHWGAKQRLRSAKNVLDEMEYLIKTYGIKEVHFEDDNLTADKQRAIDICNGMIERKFNIVWHAPSGIAVYSLDDEIIEKMAEAGCYSITLAIESGSPRVLHKLMRKPVNLDKVPGLVRKIRSVGMDVRGFFILGYPEETRAEIQATVDFAKKIELDWAYFSIFSPLPKTHAYKICIEKGYIKDGDFDPVRSFHRSIVKTPEFDPAYLHEVREQAIIDTCFKYNPNLLKYDVNKAIENFESVVRRYPHFDFANFYLGEAYLRKNDLVSARAAYKNTLKANPRHEEAQQRLKELGDE
ncbi:MAG: radical SAM protein [Candidatus Omnitrophica bacterium]|nr:radical SAM protein [Candidatus Omnitrophota bacterium]